MFAYLPNWLLVSLLTLLFASFVLLVIWWRRPPHPRVMVKETLDRLRRLSKCRPLAVIMAEPPDTRTWYIRYPNGLQVTIRTNLEQIDIFATAPYFHMVIWRDHRVSLSYEHHVKRLPTVWTEPNQVLACKTANEISDIAAQFLRQVPGLQ